MKKVYKVDGKRFNVAPHEIADFLKLHPNAIEEPPKSEQYQYQVGDSVYDVNKDENEQFLKLHKNAKKLRSPEFKPKYKIGVDGNMVDVSKRDILNALYDKNKDRNYLKRLKKGELKINVENDDAFEAELEKLIGNKRWWTGELSVEQNIESAKNLIKNRNVIGINKLGEGVDWVKGKLSPTESGSILPGHELDVKTLDKLYPENESGDRVANEDIVEEMYQVASHDTDLDLPVFGTGQKELRDKYSQHSQREKRLKKYLEDLFQGEDIEVEEAVGGRDAVKIKIGDWTSDIHHLTGNTRWIDDVSGQFQDDSGNAISKNALRDILEDIRIHTTTGKKEDVFNEIYDNWLGDSKVIHGKNVIQDKHEYALELAEHLDEKSISAIEIVDTNWDVVDGVRTPLVHTDNDGNKYEEDEDGFIVDEEGRKGRYDSEENKIFFAEHEMALEVINGLKEYREDSNIIHKTAEKTETKEIEGFSKMFHDLLGSDEESVNMEGYVQLNDGTKLSYKYLLDHRHVLQDIHAERRNGNNLGSSEMVLDYKALGIPENQIGKNMVNVDLTGEQFDGDVDEAIGLMGDSALGIQPEKYKKISDKIKLLKSGHVRGEDGSIISVEKAGIKNVDSLIKDLQLEAQQLAVKYGFEDMIDSNGAWTSDKMKQVQWVASSTVPDEMIKLDINGIPTGETREMNEIDKMEIDMMSMVDELVGSKDENWLKSERVKAYHDLMSWVRIAYENKGTIIDGTKDIMAVLHNTFDARGDGLDNDLSQLTKAYHQGHPFELGGSTIGGLSWEEGLDKDIKYNTDSNKNKVEDQRFLTKLPGGSRIAKKFNEALVRYKTLALAVDANINPMESNMENYVFGDGWVNWGEVWKGNWDNVVSTGETSTWRDGLAKSFGGAGSYKITQDELVTSFEHTLQEGGFYVPDVVNEGWNGGGNNDRHMMNLASNTVTSLAPLLMEIAVFKKLGGLGVLQKTVGQARKIMPSMGGAIEVPGTGLIGKTGRGIENIAKASGISGVKWLGRQFTKLSNSKYNQTFVNKIVAPAIITPLEWDIAENMGEAVLADGSGTWDAHTVHFDRETGEMKTNLAFPIAMGVSGGLLGIGTKAFHNMFIKPRMKKQSVIGQTYLKLMDTPGAAVAKTFTKWGAQGVTGSGLLYVSSTVDQINKDYQRGWWPWTDLDPFSEEGRARKEEWDSFNNKDHFVATTIAMLTIGTPKMPAKLKKAIYRDAMKFKIENAQSELAAKKLEMYKRFKKNGDKSWNEHEIDLAKRLKIHQANKEINKLKKELEKLEKERGEGASALAYDAVNGSKTKDSIENTKKEIQSKEKSIKEFEAHARELNRRNEVVAMKKGLKVNGEYERYLLDQYNISNKLNSGKLEVDELDRLGGLKKYEFELYLDNLGVEKNSEQGQYLSSLHEVVVSSYNFANAAKLEKGSKARKEFMESKYKLAHNIARMKGLKNVLKENPYDNAKTKYEIEKLEKENNSLEENIKEQYKKYEAEWAKRLDRQLAHDKKIAERLGAQFNILNTKLYQSAADKEDADAQGEAFISRDGKRIYINRDAALAVRNLGVGLHEITHKILWNHLKETYKIEYKDKVYDSKQVNKLKESKDKKDQKFYNELLEKGISSRRVSTEGIKIIDLMLEKIHSKDRAKINKRIDTYYKYEMEKRLVIPEGFIEHPTNPRLLIKVNEKGEPIMARNKMTGKEEVVTMKIGLNMYKPFRKKTTKIPEGWVKHPTNPKLLIKVNEKGEPVKELNKKTGKKEVVTTENVARDIKRDPKLYYEEYITALGDLIKNKNIDRDFITGRKLGQIIWPFAKKAYPNMYKFDINGVNSKKAAEDLFDLIETIQKEGEVGTKIDAKEIKIEGEPKQPGEVRQAPESRSDVATMLDKYNGNVRRMLDGPKSELVHDRDGHSVWARGEEFMLRKSAFGQEIMPIVESITQKLFDPIPKNIVERAIDGGNHKERRMKFQEDIISNAATLVKSEFKQEKLGKNQTIDDFISSRLWLRSMKLAEQLGIPGVEQSSKEVRREQKFGEDTFELQLGGEDAALTKLFEVNQVAKVETETSQFKRDVGAGEGTKKYTELKSAVFNTTIEAFKKTNTAIFDAKGVRPEFIKAVEKNMVDQMYKEVKSQLMGKDKHNFLKEHGKTLWEEYIMKSLDGQNYVVATSQLTKSILETYPNMERFGVEELKERASVKETLALQGVEKLRKTTSATAGNQVWRVKTWEQMGGQRGLEAFLLGKYKDPKTGEMIDAVDILGYKAVKSVNNYYAGKVEALAKFMSKQLLTDAVPQVLAENKITTATGENVNKAMEKVIQALGGKEGVNFSISEKVLHIENAETILKDIWENGNVGDVIGKNEAGENILLKQYGQKEISQYTIDKVAELWETGKIDSAKELKFKEGIENHKDYGLIPEDIRKAIRGGKNTLKMENENVIKDYVLDLPEITKALGKEVLAMTGMYDLVGFQKRIMDSAARKVKPEWKSYTKKQQAELTEKYGKDFKWQKNADNSFVEGKYYQTKLQIMSMMERAKSDPVMAELVKNARLFNKQFDVFKKVEAIQNMDATVSVKLAELKKIEKEIIDGSEANISLHTEVIKRLTKLVESGKISEVSVINLLQAQTNVVSGFRALSKFELVDLRNGSQALFKYKKGKETIYTKNSSLAYKNGGGVNKSHPDWKDAVEFYGSEANALKNWTTKGEHLAPSANTNIKLVEFMMEVSRSGKYKTDAQKNNRIREILEGHSQLLTNKYITDVIDKGGKNSPLDFHRVKFLNQFAKGKGKIENIYSIGGKKYMEFLSGKELGKWEKKALDKSNVTKDRMNTNEKIKDLNNQYSISGKKKGMSTFDFDETLIIKGENFIKATHPVKGTRKISSEAWPIEGEKLAREGFEFDFGDFVNVKGGVDGPLLQKMKNQINKYGVDNVFVLTARPQASAYAIHQWLKSKGINIPIKNITGLGNGAGIAKAEWMMKKFEEGYNDMYFVDDALPNVKAVKKVLSQLDVKSSVMQAKNNVKIGKYIVDVTKKEGRDFVKNYETNPGKKVVFLAGGAGSGKGNVVKKLNLKDQGFEIVNQDISLEWLKKQEGLPEDMKSFTKEQRSTMGKIGHQARGIAQRKRIKFQGQGKGIVVDGTGGSIKAMEKLVAEFKEKGYETSMLFVETSIETALTRNKARKERSLLDIIVKKNHESVQKNKPGFKEMFKEHFMEVKTDKLKQKDLMPSELVAKMSKFVGRQKDLKLGKELPDWIVDTSTLSGKKLLEQVEGLPEVKAGGKSKVQFSKSLDVEFNDMMFRAGAPKGKVDKSTAKIKGRNIGKWDLFVPPSAEDFKGLMYKTLGTGKQGTADMAWMKDNLFTPFAEGIRDHTIVKQKMAEEYSNLRKKSEKVDLNKSIYGTVYNNNNAVRVYLWNKLGYEIPGLSKANETTLVNHVKNNKDLVTFAETLSSITRLKNGYSAPSEYWMVESVAKDLNDIAKTKRIDFLSKWKENKDIIFSPKNLNKLEAIHGSGYREALDNILYRMESGTNRLIGTKDGPTKLFYNWVNNAVGTTMFWNTRSAVLQTISMVNFMNHKENNMFAVAKAVGNRKQFFKDFAFIMNSPMLKQRRAGLEIDVSASELTNIFENSGGNWSSILNWALQKGFTPTRYADSFAIATGGAPFYRNRYNMYIKQGLSVAKAKEKAWLDFQELAEETQQSSRPDLISQQQAGPLGRIILAWQNTPMQMTRLMKKALSDIVNRRRMEGHTTQWQSDRTNISRVLYYGAAQNLWFMTLQSGLAWLMFGSDMEDKIEKKELQVINGAFDTLLRGTGIYGAGIATLKNTILRWRAEQAKGYGKKDNAEVVLEMVNLSPPIGSKVRKIYRGLENWDYNKGVAAELPWYSIENPNLHATASIIEGLTNYPVARTLNKANNLEEAITGNHELWQRTAMGLGWSRWNVGADDEELTMAKMKAKIRREKRKKIQTEIKKKQDAQKDKEEKENQGLKQVRCSGKKSGGQRCSIQVWTKDGKPGRCQYHKTFKDGSDTDGDGVKEYRCTGTKTNGKRCNNKTENKNKKCYAHQ